MLTAPVQFTAKDLQIQSVGTFHALRVETTFALPPDLPIGHYFVSVCNVGCRKGIGDLVGGPLAVGVERAVGHPPQLARRRPVVRALPGDAAGSPGGCGRAGTRGCHHAHVMLADDRLPSTTVVPTTVVTTTVVPIDDRRADNSPRSRP